LNTASEEDGELLVAEAVVKSLLEAGVEEVYGLPGGEVLDFLDATRRLGLPFILTRHESAASFAADVTGQITGRPGACVSTLGPGATNMVTGVANAYLDRSPVIAITGQMAPEAYETMPHQRLDLHALYQPVTKWSVKVTPQNALALVPTAVEVALRRPRGPVHLELAGTVCASEAIAPGCLSVAEQPPGGEQRSTITFEGVLRRLECSNRPALLVGINVEPVSITGPLRNLAERFQMPVLVSPKAKGVFPHDHRLFVGVVGGMAADDRVLEFIQRCDLLVGVGFDAGEVDKTWPATAPMIWLEDAPRDPAELPGDYLVGSIASALAAIAEAPKGGGWAVEELAMARRRIREKVERGSCQGSGVSPRAALLAIRDVLPEDGAFVCDVGAHKLLSGQMWPVNRPLRFFMSNGFSSMGYGVPAAIAVKRSLGGCPVIAVIGDGGLAMMVHELETAVRAKQGVVYVVFDDESLSLIQVAQSRRKLQRYGVDFGPTNWALTAESFGAKGIRVSTIEELKCAVGDNMSGTRPTVIDIAIDASEYAVQL
jgi:acetolactate synthase-1/2/3 large subunit